jgi:hypothetical protein
MDWMCEPMVLRMTGLTAADHQRLTIDSFLTLRDALGDLVIPVLQGWEHDDYLRHVEQYSSRGVDLTVEQRVGLGTVCRRQGTQEAEAVVRTLSSLGLRLHGFGIKVSGLYRYADELVSADSMAWSFDARRAEPIPGHRHRACNNCIEWALRWQSRLLDKVDTDPWAKAGWL